jgi:hypothetical protein
VQAFVAVLSRPAAFYASLRTQSGFGAPVVFAAAMAVAAAVLAALLAAFGLGAGPSTPGAAGTFTALVLSPVTAVVGCFVGGAVVHLVSSVAGGKGTFEVAQGTVALHLADRRRTFAACAALGVLVGLLGAAGYVGERAARDRGDMEDRFGEGSEFQREMRRAQEELRRAADDARARQEGGR